MSEAGPFYEVTGPSAHNVREDMFKKLKRSEMNPDVNISDQDLKKILLENIPDTKTDFGSWRGYATFGLDKSIIKKINEDINNLKKLKQKI